MGMANKVPGVSGGTVAFVLGFYEQFIYSLQKINLKAFKLFFGGRWLSFYRYINGPFLFPIFLGSLFSYFSFSMILDFLLERYSIYVWASFFGMVLGSIIFIVKGFDQWNRRTIIALMLGAVAGFSINFMNIGAENDQLWFVFICGVIGVSGMTLPGLSGSFILMLLGNYVLLMVDAVNALFGMLFSVFSGDFSFLSDPVQLHYIEVIVVFGAGSLVGLVSLSQLLSYLLKNFHDVVIAVIIGFITGSLGAVWPWKTAIYLPNTEVVRYYKRYWPDWSSIETYVAVLWVILGAAGVLFIDYIAKKIKQRKHAKA